MRVRAEDNQVLLTPKSDSVMVVSGGPILIPPAMIAAMAAHLRDELP